MTAIPPVPRVLAGRFIRLEPLEPAHLPGLYRALARPEVFAGGYGGGPEGLWPDEAAFRERFPAALPVGGITYVAVVQSGPDAGAVVGSSSLADFDERREHAHIGWTGWHPAVWGGPVNPEAKLLMLTEAFDHGFGRVKLQADERNARSRAAILKLGARFEGITRRDVRRADGSWRDTAVHAILVDEWPDIRAGLEARLAAFVEAGAVVRLGA